MEALTKRILAIVLIAVIGVGIGVGAWFFLAPGAENPFIYPGLEPSKKPLSNTIKFGLLDDMSWSGEGAWGGMYIAARRINLGGGVEIGGVNYWVGMVAEDTKEAAYDFDTAEAATYAMIEHAPHAMLGGFRSEVFSDYQTIAMGGHVPFLITGTATRDWCWVRVKNQPEIYNYTFRLGPLNNQRMGVIIGNYVNNRLLGNISNHMGYPVENITVVYEKLIWVGDVRDEFIATVQAKNPGITMILKEIPAGGIAFDYDTMWYTIAGSKSHLIVPIISDPTVGANFGARYGLYHPNALVAGINVMAQFDVYPLYTYNAGYKVHAGLYEITSHGFSYNNGTPYILPFLEEYFVKWGESPIYTTWNGANGINIIVDLMVAADKILNGDELVLALEQLDYSNPYQGLNQFIGFDEAHDILPQNGSLPVGWGENQFRQWQPLNLSNPNQYMYQTCPLVPGWDYGNETRHPGYFSNLEGPLDTVTYPTIGLKFGIPLNQTAYSNEIMFPHWWLPGVH
ncbi:MAG: ABC transporter substrate-binding protein [Promethearchaeota archaeon]